MQDKLWPKFSAIAIACKTEKRTRYFSRAAKESIFSGHRSDQTVYYLPNSEAMNPDPSSSFTRLLS